MPSLPTRRGEGEVCSPPPLPTPAPPAGTGEAWREEPRPEQVWGLGQQRREVGAATEGSTCGRPGGPLVVMWGDSLSASIQACLSFGGACTFDPKDSIPRQLPCNVLPLTPWKHFWCCHVAEEFLGVHQHVSVCVSQRVCEGPRGECAWRPGGRGTGQSGLALHTLPTV